MFTATFFFIGLAVCIVAGLVCFLLAMSIKAKKDKQAPTITLSLNEKEFWKEIKSAMTELYSDYESKENLRMRVLRSWAGTLLICAGLCLIGVVLEVEYDQTITADNIFSGLLRTPRISASQVMKPISYHRPATEPTDQQAKMSE